MEDKVLHCSPGWPGTPYITQNHLKLMSPSASPPEKWESRHGSTMSDLRTYFQEYFCLLRATEFNCLVGVGGAWGVCLWVPEEALGLQELEVQVL